ncbi:hypothetical protein GCM10011491_22450 [Brucella endophytica]|uniref:Bile acid:sodium symporter n=1 Tax=Brucella endophytica TaxID=1963359 RepID=A0A916SCK2_9HYPH|nr:hypothetical protein [Brucella endophytica]GGA93763.1 hypothetical protein GCM10011491_22450 [Brucella endophytica]
MSLLHHFLHFLARHGRYVLVGGLVVGIAFPALAALLQPMIPEIVAIMLFAAALRIGPAQAFGRLGDIRVSLGMVALYQLLLPCGLALAFLFLGLSGPLATGAVLVTAASPISGSPNLTLLTGNDPAPALRLLITGTALLPLTVLPAFALWPAFGTAGAVIFASVKLVCLIGVAAALAFAIRHFLLPRPDARTITAIDGFSALMMAIAVIGLTSAIGPAFTSRPGALVMNLLAAFAVNFGLQVLAFSVVRVREPAKAVAYAIVAGNRNAMLFLAALPVAAMEPLLLFIACYQVPMYLTPILLGKLYAADRDRSYP